MLRVDRSVVEAIVAHARRDHPDEACGMVAGPVGSDRPDRFIPMLNAERSPTFYRFEASEELRVWREMDDRDEEPVVIYHSHTATEAYPSRTDIGLASVPDAHYVLVSTRDDDVADIRSYRIVDGVVTEEPIEMTSDGQPESAPASGAMPDESVDTAKSGKPDLASAGASGRPDAVQSFRFGHSPTAVVYDCSGRA